VSFVNVSPAGSVPLVSVIDATTGNPSVVMSKVRSTPIVKVSVFVLVNVGGSFTTSVKFWMASGVTPFVAVNCREYEPPVLAPGVPSIRAVPSRSSMNESPRGSVPVSEIVVTVGKPVVVMSNVRAAPTSNVSALALVKDGG
jgi:hypothetical protein